MTKLLAVLLLLFGASPAAARQAAEWKKFTSPQGGFSVLMPGAPEENKKVTEQSPHGPYTTYLFVARDAGEIFLVGWVDYDPKFNFNVQKELEANRDNFIKNVKAKLLTTGKASLGANPGLEFTAESEQALFRSWVYVVGRRPYQLIAVSPKGAAPSPNVARFHSSFALLATR